MPHYYPGQRLSTKSQRCTVRYVGEVQGKRGQWLGVEWDDPRRGKHSGTHGDRQYFKCRSNWPTAGSFLPPTTKWDQPRAFIEALRSKYAATVGNSDVPNDPEVQVVRISGKTAEEVGFDKIARQQSQLENLRIVVLDGELIKHEYARGAGEDISQTCPSITDLDLGRNLFETLAEIEHICAQLDRLRSLKLDGNRLREFFAIGEDSAQSPNALRKVAALDLSDMMLSTAELDPLLRHFPNIKSLSASANQLSTLHQCRLPASLDSISLENNDFTFLDQVSSLSESCMQLRTLILKNNRIRTIRNDTGKLAPILPPSLKDLDLSYNEISTWNLIDRLPELCPNLEHLRVAHNPLFESLKTADGKPLTSADGYMLTIARVPGLKTLNYSTITQKERLNAETYYLSQIAMELSLSPIDRESEIIGIHPRYHALCEEYGSPNIERTISGAIDPNSLAARLIRCSFYCREGPEKAGLLSEAGPLTVELPKSLNIYAVMGIAGKHFGLLPMRLRLVWETGEKQRVASSTTTWTGIEDWDSSDEESDDKGSDLQEREVQLVAGTRPLGTVIEGNEAVIRTEITQAPSVK
ncbi:hypothetical protein AAFC00_005508 [Neodothiora populina]|uniref:CAP-Gly domain-containing protein n=1 Tax=Neodothiora populina TaxID=2781224 RepID=A0ABR3PL35_9PEZI